MKGKRPIGFPTGCDVRCFPHSDNKLKINFRRLHLFTRNFLYTNFER